MKFLELYVGGIILWTVFYLIGRILFEETEKTNYIKLVPIIMLFSYILAHINYVNSEILNGIIKIICVYSLYCAFYKIIFKKELSKVLVASLILYLLDDVLLAGIDVVHQEIVVPVALFQVCHGIDGDVVIGDDVGVRVDGDVRGRGLGGDLGGVPVLQDAGPGGQGVARSAGEDAALIDGVLGVACVVVGDDVLIRNVIGHAAVLGPCHRAGPGLEGGREVVLVLAEDLRLVHGKGGVHAAGRVRGQVGDSRKADVVRFASRSVGLYP